MKKSFISAIFLSSILSLTALTGCSSGNPSGGAQPLSPVFSNSNGGASTVSVPPATGIDAQLKLTSGGWNNIEWTSYSDQYVTAQIPKGWKVEVRDMYQGGTTGSGTAVNITDPTGEVMVDYIDFFTVAAFTMKSPTIESFFTDAVAGADSTITSAVVTSSIQTEDQKQFAADNPSAYLDAKLLTMDVVKNGKTYEGYYCGTLINNNSSLTGLYGAITLKDLVAPKGELNNWINVLLQIQSSIQINPSRYGSGTVVSGGSSASGSSDSIMEAWNNRNRSEDILSQKRSDATLGYERVYDTATGDIYRANNGFYDSYSAQGGERYAPITDDMYDDGYSGYLTY